MNAPFERSNLDHLAPGQTVTLKNPFGYDDITGEIIADPGWAGGWRIGGMSKHGFEFQGWTVESPLSSSLLAPSKEKPK